MYNVCMTHLSIQNVDIRCVPIGAIIYTSNGNTVSLKHISFIWLFKHTIDGSYERGNVLCVSHSLLVTVTRAWGLRSIPQQVAQRLGEGCVQVQIGYPRGQGWGVFKFGAASLEARGGVCSSSEQLAQRLGIECVEDRSSQPRGQGWGVFKIVAASLEAWGVQTALFS